MKSSTGVSDLDFDQDFFLRKWVHYIYFHVSIFAVVSDVFPDDGWIQLP